MKYSPNDHIGRYATVSVGVSSEGSICEQGIIIGSTQMGNPVILTKERETFEGVKPEVAIVPDEHIVIPETLAFVTDWRKRHMKGTTK